MTFYDGGSKYKGPSSYETETFVLQGRIDELMRLLNEERTKNQILERQIDLVADWFQNKAPELIGEGSACENAVNLLDFYLEDELYSPDEVKRRLIRQELEEILADREIFETPSDSFLEMLAEQIERYSEKHGKR